MALTTWKARGAAATTLANAALASLASASGVTSGVVSNTTDGDEYGVLTLTLAFSAAPTAGSTVDVYFVRSPDGSTFEDGSASAPPQMPAYSFVLTAATPQVHATPELPIPADDFKVVLVQKSGVALAATGNSLTLRKLSEQTV